MLTLIFIPLIGLTISIAKYSGHTHFTLVVCPEFIQRHAICVISFKVKLATEPSVAAI